MHLASSTLHGRMPVPAHPNLGLQWSLPSLSLAPAHGSAVLTRDFPSHVPHPSHCADFAHVLEIMQTAAFCLALTADPGALRSTSTHLQAEGPSFHRPFCRLILSHPVSSMCRCWRSCRRPRSAWCCRETLRLRAAPARSSCRAASRSSSGRPTRPCPSVTQSTTRPPPTSSTSLTTSEGLSNCISSLVLDLLSRT